MRARSSPSSPSFPRDRDRYKSCRGGESRIVLVFTPCTSKMMPSKIPSTAAREMLTRHRAPSRICDTCFLFRFNIVIIRIFVPAHTPTPSSSRKSVGGWKKARAVGRRPNVRMSAEPSVCASRLAFARRDARGARPRASVFCRRATARVIMVRSRRSGGGGGRAGAGAPPPPPPPPGGGGGAGGGRRGARGGGGPPPPPARAPRARPPATARATARRRSRRGVARKRGSAMME